MTELRHFHSARKGSGSLRPFPIYPLYTQTVILSLDKPIADCFLFRPRKSREKRRKRSHTNVSSTLSTRSSTPPAQTAHVCFRRQKWVHTRPCSKNRTQRHTRRNRGCFGWGWYHYSRSVPHVHKHPRAGCQNGVLCRFGILAGRCSRRTQKAFGTAMRLCVSLSRGVAAPLGCVIFFASAEVAACTPCAQCFPNVRDEGWYHYPRRALRAAETPDGRLSKRLICRFLASPIYICERPCRIEKDRLRFR